ncbi:MAG: helix-turn-helix protein, partial [Polaromonas sp.]|nr:helix-turn-helix protein [Polaromonas sp.]
LASSVCRTLKVDAGPVLERLPPSSSPRLTYQGSGINTPFRAPSDGPGPSFWTQISRPAVLGGVVLLLGALVMILLPAFRGASVTDSRSDAPQPVQAVEPVKGPAATMTASGSATPNGTAALAARDLFPPDMEQAAGMSGVSLAMVPAASAVVAAAQSTPVTLVLPPAPVPAPVAALAASAASAAPTVTGVVVFTAKGPSWVEVTDARRVVVLRRTLAAGETAGASGALPLAAVVGRADATQVQVRGKAFDLAPVSRDNVARFEVK